MPAATLSQRCCTCGFLRPTWSKMTALYGVLRVHICYDELHKSFFFFRLIHTCLKPRTLSLSLYQRVAAAFCLGATGNEALQILVRFDMSKECGNFKLPFSVHHTAELQHSLFVARGGGVQA